MQFRPLYPIVGLAAFMAAALPAQAISLGQIDTFSGSAAAWFAGGGPIGAVPPAPPVVVDTGGPAGAGDSYLFVTATGASGPGGRLVAMNSGQWAGDYSSAGVSAIAMDLRNFGSTDLTLRLLFEDPGAGPPVNIAVSTAGVFLPASGGWTRVVFPVLPGDLTAILGDPAPLLGNTTLLRLFHGQDAVFPGEFIVGALGVDNISAVPAPAGWLLMMTALGALAARSRRFRL